MDYSDGDSSMQSGSRGDEANIVISIFSKVNRTSDDWISLIRRLFQALDDRIGHATGLRDKPVLDSESQQLEGPVHAGKVYELRAKLQATTEIDVVSQNDCRILRESQNGRIFEKDEDVELIFQPLGLYFAHKTPGLAVFDMDSTLIEQEVIDELARSVGRYDQVAAVTAAAMRGELNFEESLQARVAQLKGVSTGIWEYLKENVITFTPGARELIIVLRRLGWKTAVLSGGFTPLAYWVKDELGLDYAFANQLSTDESGMTLNGEVLPGTSIVGATVKRDLLLKLAAENNISTSHTVAVGDGSNDLLMMNAAGFGIAFNAKPKVQAAAPARLNSKTLLDIMYVLGFAREEIEDALSPGSLSRAEIRKDHDSSSLQN